MLDVLWLSVFCVSLSHSALGRSAISGFGISWLGSLGFYHMQHFKILSIIIYSTSVKSYQ